MNASLYAPVNLLIGNLDELIYYSNQSCQQQVLAPGIYGLSNHLLDRPWHKVATGKKALQAALQHNADTQKLLAILQDRSLPPDRKLPDTGVGIDQERLLAPQFIHSQKYGTRFSTCLRINSCGAVEFTDISYDSSGETFHEKSVHVHN